MFSKKLRTLNLLVFLVVNAVVSLLPSVLSIKCIELR